MFTYTHSLRCNTTARTGFQIGQWSIIAQHGDFLCTAPCDVRTDRRGTMTSPEQTQQNTKEEKPDIQQLTIVVKAQDGSELQFKIRPNTPLQKVFGAYAARKHLELKDCKFLADGNILTGDITAEGAGLEDGDIIDMMVTQIGGSC